MTLFVVLCSGIWSRTLNYIAGHLVKNDAPYNPKAPVSLIFEMIGMASFIYLFEYGTTLYLPLHALFLSALFITIHSDAQTMLISRYVSIYLVPVAWFGAYCGLLPISSMMSITGSLLGLFLLYATARISFYFLKTEGLGQGDVDMLAMIGAFLGPAGCWLSLLIGSFTGAATGITYMIATGKKKHLKIPFGVFLALGAIVFLLFEKPVTSFFFP